MGLNRNGSGLVLDARLSDCGPRKANDAGAVRGGTSDESGAAIGYWDTRAGRDSLRICRIRITCGYLKRSCTLGDSLH